MLLQYDDQRYTIVSSAASGCMCSQHRLPRGSNAGYAHGHARVHTSLGSGGGKHGLISIRFSLSLWFHVHACTRVRLLQFGSFPWEACVFSHSLPERFLLRYENRVCARRHFSSACFPAYRVRGGPDTACVTGFPPTLPRDTAPSSGGPVTVDGRTGLACAYVGPRVLMKIWGRQ